MTDRRSNQSAWRHACLQRAYERRARAPRLGLFILAGLLLAFFTGAM